MDERAGVRIAQWCSDSGQVCVSRRQKLLVVVALAWSLFLCESHSRLTGNPSFQDNLLDVLEDNEFTIREVNTTIKANLEEFES